MLDRRHIQNQSAGGNLQAHWGYPDRVVPCKNDAGSCAYLDVVYHSHDLGMLYMGILWATIIGILLVWSIVRLANQPAISGSIGPQRSSQGSLCKLWQTARASSRRYLLPDANHFLFGRTTRLQVLILAILSGYLILWNFLGIVYDTWVTPVKKMPGVYNTRTSLGPWSDRIGVLAYALTPLSVLLSSRESLLSVLTGVPYQNFNFLHRWLGYIIFIQSSLHTIGWCVIEIRLYQPQPKVSLEWIAQEYIIWGVVAMFLITVLTVLSTPWGIRLTGYEVFRKAHYCLAMIYIGACWAHWRKLECFLIPSFLIWGIDRFARLVRTAFLHYHPAAAQNAGFQPASATVTRFPDADGDVLRLELENEQGCWQVGQHYYLCFTECGIWQSHPFTPLNAPVVERGVVRHSYLMRAKSGETKRLAQVIEKKLKDGDASPTTSVILTGGYGENLLEGFGVDTNVLCIAGGTGITYVLPVLLQLARQSSSQDRRIELVWVVRHTNHMAWVAKELAKLREEKSFNLTIRIFATRDVATSEEIKTEYGKESVTGHTSSASSDDVATIQNAPSCPPDVFAENAGSEEQGSRRPDLRKLAGDFFSSTVSGRTTVFASGPGSMITELRSIVAGINDPLKTWKRQDRYDVDLVCDDRLEW